MAQQQSTTSDGEYEIRRYRHRDRSAFLSLYEAVWGRAKDREWFDWRFEGNPYGDGVEMIVAERAGTVVGVEPLLPLPVASGSGTVAARQPVDWIVHPDHRRRGLFTRMTERLLATVEERVPLLFNFPNDPLRPGLRKFNWTELGDRPTRYRFQSPEKIVPDAEGAGTTAATVAARVGTPAIRAGLRAADQLTSSTARITVDRVDGVAVDAVRRVYGETRPAAIHVPRQRPFLEWRFDNPHWLTRTYVARRDGDPMATIVAATERDDDSTVVSVLDVQPMTTDPERAPAVAAALGEVVRDGATADLIRAPSEPYPGVFRRHGFLSDGGFPFERFATTTMHAVRLLSPDASDALGCDVLNPDNWLLLLGDRDVA
jgi:hypothetical protein